MQRTKRIKQSIIKDAKRRILYKKYETSTIVLKSIMTNLTLPLDIRLKAQKVLKNLPLDSRISRVRNRCVITGRSRGVLPKLNLSRYKFKELVESGELPGIKKSSF